MKILLAVDGSSYTKKMLAYVTTHLEMFSGDNEFTVLTVQGALPPRARAASALGAAARTRNPAPRRADTSAGTTPAAKSG